ncbi:MAG: putative ABC exporter domain-containing protein [Acidobacteriota bacterium]
MNSALLFLLVRSLRGRVVRSLRLFKQPKYLAGILGFLLWMLFWMSDLIFRVFSVQEKGGPVELHTGGNLLDRITGLGVDGLATVHLLVALGLAAVITLWWLIPWGKVALNLREAEIHLLLPTPIKRRHLIQYATLKSQPGILFGCLMMSFFLGPGGGLAGLHWFVATWIFLTTWDLHAKGRGLWVAKLKQLTATQTTRRRLCLLAVVVVFWALVGQAIAGAIRAYPVDPGQGAFEFVREVIVTHGPRARQGLLGTALTPFLWLTAPFFTAAAGDGDLTAALLSLTMPLLILLAHNEWVVRSRTKFEEAALAHARRELVKKDSRSRFWKIASRKRRQVPFPLPPKGAAEVAILWKNLILVRRTRLSRTVMWGLTVVAVAGALPAVLGAPFWIFALLEIVGIALLAIVPMVAGHHYRNDLRTDLQNVELLRCWPLPGWRLVAAEVLAPATIATMGAALGAGLILAGDWGTRLRSSQALFDTGGKVITLTRVAELMGVSQPLLVPLFLLAALFVIVAVATLSVALQNIAVLLFPGWLSLGAEKQPGAASFGQNLLVFSAMSIALLLGTVPAALLVGSILLVQLFVLHVAISVWELPLLGAIAATPILAVAALLVQAGGKLWDRLDPSLEILSRGA